MRQRFFNEKGWRTLDEVERVAEEHEATPAQVALAWLLQRPAVVSPIIGADARNSSKPVSARMSWGLSTDDIEALDLASGSGDETE